ncbi:Hypothetical protein HDN1F_11480 [gamma proteobacterium HdN1]|nr:Hypothetical protein HDN1F_11480 [gamma proteobacterium HdN1]
MVLVSIVVGSIVVGSTSAFAAGDADNNTGGKANQGAQREIPITISGKGPWYRLTLPMPVRFAAAHADLRDVRVVNAEGESLPYSLIESESTAAYAETQISARLFPLYLPEKSANVSDLRIHVNAQGRIVEVNTPSGSTTDTLKLRGWLLDLGAHQERLQGLKLQAEQVPAGFQYFSIEASADLRHWQAWPEGQWVNLNFDGSQLQQDAVSLAGGSARYLRLIWRDPVDAPMLTGAVLASSTTRYHDAAMTWSAPLPAPALQEDNSYVWVLPLALPLERLRIAPLPENTIAPVTISGRVYPRTYSGSTQYRHHFALWRESVLHGQRSRTDTERQPAWQILARGVLSRVNVDQQETLQNEIALPAFPVQQLCLQWDERGSGLSGAIPELRVAMRERGLVFLARGSAPYRLVMGDIDAAPANLPLETLIPGYQGAATLNKLDQANVAVNEVNEMRAVASVTTPAAAESSLRKYVLWGILLAGMALLGTMVWQLARKSGDQR